MAGVGDCGLKPQALQLQGLAENALDIVTVTEPRLGQGGGGGGGGSPVSSVNEEYARAMLEEVRVTAKKVRKGRSQAENVPWFRLAQRSSVSALKWVLM